jgi:hypothetical protein
LRIAIPQLDIVRRSRTRFEANDLADNKRGGFSFKLSNSLTGTGPAVTAMKKLVSLCFAQHKLTYVAMEFMWRTAFDSDSEDDWYQYTDP